MTLADNLIVVTNLVLESVLCLADPRVATIPVHPSVGSGALVKTLNKLARQGYRRRLAKGALEQSLLADDSP